MTNYEWTLVVTRASGEPLDDGIIEHLGERFDCVVGMNHGGEDFITVTCPGQDSLGAARDIVTSLRWLRVFATRSVLDLVDRRDIARRAAVSRQAVGNWVRGDRLRQTVPFPEPFNDVGGGVWLWGDVQQWLVQTGHPVDDEDMSYPTREDHDRLNASLLAGQVDPVHRAVVAEINHTTGVISGPFGNVLVSGPFGNVAWGPGMPGAHFVERERRILARS
jgi:hypothetical protein